MHSGATSDYQEKEAEHFAGCFLMPAGAFGRHYLSYPGGVDWREYLDMKRTWGVSLAAMVRRAYELGLIDALEYRRRFKYMRYKGWHRGEPFEPAAEAPEMIINAIATAEKRMGGVRALSERLGWPPSTFMQLTGYSEQTAETDVVPLSRPRLAVM